MPAVQHFPPTESWRSLVASEREVEKKENGQKEHPCQNSAMKQVKQGLESGNFIFLKRDVTWGMECHPKAQV